MSAGRGCVTWEIVPSYQRLNIDETARDNMGGRSMTPATLRHHVANISVAALLLAALSASATAQETNFKAASVKTPDGLTISAQDWGNPNEPERYKDSKAWGDEVQAVMDATGLKRPVLVGWSYGGRVMADYLKTHGTAKLAGLNDVDAGQKADPSFFGPNLKNLPPMASDDLATNIAATRAFLRDCFSKQPSQDEFEIMLSFNMMVPPKVRLGLSNRPLEVDDLLKSLKLPVLVTHGSEDKNSNLIAAEYTAKMIPGAKLSVYQGIGHSPFFEDAPRFNAELAAFVRSAQKGN